MNRRKRGVIVGFDYYSKYLASLVNEHSSAWRLRAFGNSRAGTLAALWELRHADALISFGGPGPNVALAEFARRRNIPVIVIWAGSDVTTVARKPFELQVTKRQGFINLSDGPWLLDELRLLGITAEYLPVTAVRSGGGIRPLPDRFRVLTYLPEPRRDFYGAQDVYEIARALPQIEFSVVGHGGRDPRAPENVTFHGYVGDMRERIDDSTVLLRLPEHDGKSMLVLESLARARHVVWNYDFPAVERAEDRSQALEIIRALYEQHCSGSLKPNAAGRTYVLRHFSRPQIAARFEERLEAARGARRERTETTQRVAISGLGFFCAAVAEQVERRQPNWETAILRTNSRLEVLTSMLTLARADVWYSIGSPVADRWLDFVARVLRKPHVLHWVGSDIDTVRRQPNARRIFNDGRMTHLTEVQWTANELRRYGIDSHIVPLPPRNPAGAVYPLPDVFTIMLYVPRTRADFYGRCEYERLMAHYAYRPVRFLIVGGGHVDVPPGVDARNLGWRDRLEEAYRETTVLVRFTERDGLALMVLEALSFGRYVLWSQDFPHTTTVRSYDDMRRELDDLLARHDAGKLQPRQDAAEMVRSHYSADRCLSEITEVWSAALGRTQTPERLEALQ